MKNFMCKVMTPQGQVIKIKLTEEDKMSCLKKLKRNGMTPIEVKPALIVPPNVSRKISASIVAKRKEEKVIKLSKEVVKSISIEDIKSFTQDLLLLRQAKFTNEHALKTIISNTKNQNFKHILKEILKNNEKEIYMYKTMEKYSQVFPLIYINLIKNGELTESLDEGLKNAISYLENEEKLDSILQEKVFPNILLIFSIVLIMFLSVVLGIPLVQDLLVSINSSLKLPFITRIVMKICNLVVYKWYILLGIIAILILILWLNLRSPEGKLKFDKIKYKNRLCGNVLYLLDFSRVIRCLVINLDNKMRMQDSLEVCKNVVSNLHMSNTIEKSINMVFKGKPWIEAFADDKILNPIVIEMLKKNSETKSTELISKTIGYLELQIDKEFDKLIVRLAEISYIILGLLFLIYIGTILLPCISVYLSSFLVF